MLIGRTLIDARAPMVLLIARDMTGKGQIPNPTRILILTGIGSRSWLTEDPDPGWQLRGPCS